MGDRAWRWEFLRRRKNYRDDWERAYEKALVGREDIGGVNFPQVVARPGKKRKSESSLVDINFIVSMPEARIKFGIASMVDPRRTDGFIRFEDGLGFFLRGQTVTAFWAMGLNPWASDSHHIQNLKNLLGNMREELNWKQLSKGHRQNWATYLRILDARADGSTKAASYAEIGEVLRPDELIYNDAAAFAKQSHERAKELMKKLTTPLEIT
jgi:hypothetical protein